MVRHYLFVEFILKYSCDWLQSFSSKENALMYYGSSAFSVANVPWFRTLVQTIYQSKGILICSSFSFALYNAEPSVVDRAINDICILLQCSRHNLNVVYQFTFLSVSKHTQYQYISTYIYVDIQYIQVFRTSTVLSWETIHRVCSLSLLFVFIYMLIFHCGRFNEGSEF